MKNASSNRKKKINHLKTSRFFLLDQFLRKMKMKACIVLHVLGSGEYTLPAGQTCPFPWKGKIFFSEMPLTLMVFPQSVRTVTCIPLGCKQRQLLARTKQINSICAGNVPSQVLCQCVQRQGATQRALTDELPRELMFMNDYVWYLENIFPLETRHQTPAGLSTVSRVGKGRLSAPLPSGENGEQKGLRGFFRSSL